MHVDHWIEGAAMSRDPAVQHASFVLHIARLPAFMKAVYAPIIKDVSALFCTYKGERYRVTGASRMGDVWLAKNHEREFGYDLRVDVDECSAWARKP